MKLIRGLATKKVRQEEGLFVVQGDKLVKELLGGTKKDRQKYRIHSLYATGDWIEENGEIISEEHQIIETSPRELKQLSSQQSPNQILALVTIPEDLSEDMNITDVLSLGLYQLRDPGNLGTILRTADWFGIRHIICSPDSVDLYNSKVIQSSMGSFLRVNVIYRKLEEVIHEQKVDKNYKIYATGMKGESIYKDKLMPGMILLGNESHGLPDQLLNMADITLRIPYNDPDSHAESLNVATSAAIICAEFRRQGI